jgi:hypothetical protein
MDTNYFYAKRWTKQTHEPIGGRRDHGNLHPAPAR